MQDLSSKQHRTRRHSHWTCETGSESSTSRNHGLNIDNTCLDGSTGSQSHLSYGEVTHVAFTRQPYCKPYCHPFIFAYFQMVNVTTQDVKVNFEIKTSVCINILTCHIKHMSIQSNEGVVRWLLKPALYEVLTASRRGQDKRGHHTSAAISHKQCSWQNVWYVWQHVWLARHTFMVFVATCAYGYVLNNNMSTCKAFVEFLQTPVCPDPVWKSVNIYTTSLPSFY